MTQKIKMRNWVVEIYFCPDRKKYLSEAIGAPLLRFEGDTYDEVRELMADAIDAYFESDEGDYAWMFGI